MQYITTSPRKSDIQQNNFHPLSVRYVKCLYCPPWIRKQGELVGSEELEEGLPSGPYLLVVAALAAQSTAPACQLPFTTS